MKRLLPLILLFLLLGGCASTVTPKHESKPYNQEMSKLALKKIQEEGKLRVLTRYAPTIYTIGPDGKPVGFEYDLVNEFAAHLGVKAEFIVLYSVSEVLKSIKLGHGDMASAGLTMTEQKVNDDFIFGEGYLNVAQQVVCNRTSHQHLPTSLNELQKTRLLVAKDSGNADILREFQKKYPHMDWQETSALSTESILQEVNEKKVECTVTDSNIYDFNRKFFPNLVSPMSIGEEQQLAWIVAPLKTGLAYIIDEWMADFYGSSKYLEIEERYFGHVEEKFKQSDAVVFHNSIKARLPQFKDDFLKAGKKYELPWRFLAATSYQESSWLRDQTSSAGAVGLMMLMPATAKEMGVRDIYNTSQNIMGGARYLKKLLQQTPEGIDPKDKYLFALAAYNIGLGHVLDAMTLCDINGKNRYSWNHVKEMLPRLKYKENLKHLKFGWARGSETVRYVDNIKTFWEIIEKIELTQ